MPKFNQLDDIIDILDRAKDMALKYGFVEYASQMERLSNKMQVEADFLFDQHTKAIAAPNVVQLTVDDFMGMRR
jgi:hypothetical protein